MPWVLETFHAPLMASTFDRRCVGQQQSFPHTHEKKKTLQPKVQKSRSAEHLMYSKLLFLNNIKHKTTKWHISIPVYPPCTRYKHAVSTCRLEHMQHTQHTQCNAKGGISRDFLLKSSQNYSTEDQIWYAPKCLQHLEVDGLQNGFRLIEFYEQHDEYPVIG